MEWPKPDPFCSLSRGASPSKDPSETGFPLNPTQLREEEHVLPWIVLLGIFNIPFSVEKKLLILILDPSFLVPGRSQHVLS